MDHGIGIEVGDSRIVFLADGHTYLHTPRGLLLHPPLPKNSQSGCAAADAVIAENFFFNGVSNFPSKATGQRRGKHVICPLDVEHISAGTNYTSDASVTKTSGVVATKPLLISALLQNVSQQGVHDEASASRGCGITRPTSPPAGHRGTGSSFLGKRVTEGGGIPSTGTQSSWATTGTHRRTHTTNEPTKVPQSVFSRGGGRVNDVTQGSRNDGNNTRGGRNDGNGGAPMGARRPSVGSTSLPSTAGTTPAHVSGMIPQLQIWACGSGRQRRGTARRVKWLQMKTSLFVNYY